MNVTVPMGSTERDALGKKRLERGVHGVALLFTKLPLCIG